jgi:hypothetical protein
VDNAFKVAKHDCAQVDRFDEPARAVDLGDVSDAHLILQNDEKATQHVAYERLSAKTDRQPKNAGAGQDRRNVDTKLIENHQERDADDDHGQNVLQHGAERSCPLCTLQCRDSGAPGQFQLEMPRENAEASEKAVRQQGNQRDSETGAEKPRAQRRRRQAPARLPSDSPGRGQ